MAASRKKDEDQMQTYGWILRFVGSGSDKHRLQDPSSRLKYFGQRLSQLAPFFEENDIAIASKQEYTLTLCILASPPVVNRLRHFVEENHLGEIDICENVEVARAAATRHR